MGGAGALGVILLFVISQLTGTDVSGLFNATNNQQQQAPQVAGAILDECKTGADANSKVDCRMAGAYTSLEEYWSQEYPVLRTGNSYHEPDFQLFTNSISTACGAATSATGPFYCPGDESIYIDTAFYDQLRTQFGASGGPLSELYIVAHEWGHHVQNLAGTFASSDRRATGPTSDTVRIELQADCFAGAWVAAASTTRDRHGVPLLQAPTRAQISDALDAAATVGDDRIQQQATGRVSPEGWTHGSSEQRQRWFLNGFNGGATACDTFAAQIL